MVIRRKDRIIGLKWMGGSVHIRGVPEVLAELMSLVKDCETFGVRLWLAIEGR